jgi:hypothetical protein
LLDLARTTFNGAQEVVVLGRLLLTGFISPFAASSRHFCFLKFVSDKDLI